MSMNKGLAMEAVKQDNEAKEENRIFDYEAWRRDGEGIDAREERENRLAQALQYVIDGKFDDMLSEVD